MPTDGSEASSSMLGEVLARLRFLEGDIRLGEERLILLHGAAFGALRAELIEHLGYPPTRAMLTRAGFSAGAADARSLRRSQPDLSIEDAFRLGPRLHGMQGMVRAELVELNFSLEKGEFSGEFLWHESLEADLHILHHGMASEPCCWMQTGYACGFASTFMGQQIAFQEVRCRAAGASKCHLIARPVEDWEARPAALEAYRASDDGDIRPYRDAHSLTNGGMPIGAETVGASSGFAAAVHEVRQVASTRATVLFTGETGVGKERFARLVHELGDRKNGPFIAVNCAALPESLMEAELFGVEPGAFTDAQRARRGRFERANGGTLFLDEVGLLSKGAQGKLLRVLQEREVERVGGEAALPVDVRVVAATNLELEQEVAARRFRADLYYRLSVYPVHIPPLRERRDDVPALCGFFLQRYARLHGKRLTGLTERSLELLLEYEFPGNVRELENMIERGVIRTPDGQPLDVSHLLVPPGRALSRFGVARDGRLRRVRQREGEDPLDALIDRALADERSFDALEQAVLARVVEREGGNVAAAARRLGMTRRQLDYRLKAKQSTPP